MPTDDLDPRAQAVMEPGETLLWTGRTSAVARAFLRELVGEDITGIVGWAAFFTGILITVILEPYLRREDVWTILKGNLLAIAVLGLFLTFPISVFLTFLARARSVYAISDRRVLRIPRGMRQKPLSYEVDPLSVKTSSRQDGSGDILFASERCLTVPDEGPTRRAGIYRIPDVRRVEKLLLATVVRRQAEALPHPRQRSRASLNVGSDLQSSRPKTRARAIASLLYADEAILDAALQEMEPSARMVRALGVSGMWRDIGIGGARILVAGLSGILGEHHGAVQAVGRLAKDGVASLVRAWAVVEDTAGRYRLLEAFELVDRDALAAALAEVLLTPDRASAVGVAQQVRYARVLREPVIEAWLTSGAGVVSPLVALLRDEGGRARWWAAEALGDPLAAGMPDQVRAALGTDADPTDPPQAAVLAYLGDPAGVQALARALGERDDDAIRVVADALGRLGAPAAPALDALREAADGADDGETRSRCRRAIRRIQNALGLAPAELEAASAPAGTGTEPEAAMPPEGTGTELTSAGPPTERQRR